MQFLIKFIYCFFVFVSATLLLQCRVLFTNINAHCSQCALTLIALLWITTHNLRTLLLFSFEFLFLLFIFYFNFLIYLHFCCEFVAATQLLQLKMRAKHEISGKMEHKRKEKQPTTTTKAPQSATRYRRQRVAAAVFAIAAVGAHCVAHIGSKCERLQNRNENLTLHVRLQQCFCCCFVVYAVDDMRQV